MITTREEISRQAFRLFHEYGYDNVSIDRICKKCGVSRGSFYHHFRSKDEMLLTWFDEHIISRAGLYVDRPDGTAMQQLSNYCEHYAEFLSSIGSDLLYHIILADFSTNGEHFTTATMNNSKYLYLRDEHISLIQQSQAEGSINPLLPPENILLSYASGLAGLIVTWKLSKGNFDFKEHVRILFETIHR